MAEKCEGLINSGWGGELSGILDLRGGKNGGLLTSEDCLGLRNMLLYFSLVLHHPAFVHFKKQVYLEQNEKKGESRG